jgi:hypothetical protein
MNRPDINEIETGAELKRWYWLKEELVDFCKKTEISYVGAKFDILERIADQLDNGSKPNAKPRTINRQSSNFDWHSAALSLDTVITDNYKNTQNVRQFFKQYCGGKFHFSIPFMAFMKANIGKTLNDAVEEWEKLNQQRKDKDFKSDIPSGNQYNKYIRDFFADNPTMTIEQARHFWKLKRSLPLGRHVYEKEDLLLK